MGFYTIKKYIIPMALKHVEVLSSVGVILVLVAIVADFKKRGVNPRDRPFQDGAWGTSVPVLTKFHTQMGLDTNSVFSHF